MRLSICIPTYNRGAFLGDLLDSILSQRGYSCEIEVVISDNASTDNTADVIDQYRGRFERLNYVRAPQNVGADRNYLRVVELATGDWCWLMGSDDVLEEGSLATLEAAIAQNPDVAGLSVGRNVRSFTLEKRGEQRVPRGWTQPGSGLVTTPESAFENLAAYYSYLSGQVVRRTLWNEAVASSPVDQFYNAYVHVYVIGRMLQRCPRWYYLAELLVGWREGNDFFLSEGAFNRLRIDVVGYEEIARALFGERSATYRHINTDIATGLLYYRLLGSRLNGAERAFFIDTAKLVFPRYWRYPLFWTKTAPIFIIPTGLMRAFRSLYRQVK